MLKVGSWNLYCDLKEGFECIDNDYSQLQSDWETFKRDGRSEDDLNETITADMYNAERDWVRSIMFILDMHLEDFKLKS